MVAFLLEMRATFNAVAEPTDRPVAAQLSAAARTLLVSDGRAAPDAQVQVARMVVRTARADRRGECHTRRNHAHTFCRTCRRSAAKHCGEVASGSARLSQFAEGAGTVSPPLGRCRKAGKRCRKTSRSYRHHSELLARRRRTMTIVRHLRCPVVSWRSTSARSASG